MSELNFLNLGLAGAALLAMIMVVQYFLKALKERDEKVKERDTLFMNFIAIQQKDFQELVKNHITCNTNSMTNLEKSNIRLVDAIQEFIKFSSKKLKKKVSI
jgi:hypothetical protein